MRFLTRRLLFLEIAVPAMLRAQLTDQQQKARALAVPKATVRAVAYEANGRYIGAPDISLFVDEGGHENLASRFHDGVAVEIPYSLYRIEGRRPGYYSDAKYVRIYQPLVTVVLGLRFSAESSPLTLSGRVVGYPGPAEKTFAKVIGVYENVSAESPISSDGKFTLGALSPGLFILLVVGEKGVIASRTVTIPYTGPPLEIEVKNDGVPLQGLGR